MSFESMFESPIPLRDAAEFFMKLKYAENMPQPPMAEEAQPSSDMDQSVEMQAPDMPMEVMALADLARLKLQAALGYRVYSESLRDLTNTALGEHFKEHSENELEHADYLIRRIAVMHGPVELGQIEPPPPATDVQEILSVLMDAERELIAKLQEVHAVVGENPMKYELEAMMVLDQHHFDDLMQHQPAQAPVQSAGQVVPAAKMAANDIQLPATAMGQQKPVEPMPALMGTAAGQQAKIAFLRAVKSMRVKTAAETVDPDTMAYLQEQQDAEQATNEAEEGYYRQRFQAAAQQLQATQAQLEQQQQEIQGLQEAAAQHQQESDSVLQQAQQTQQMASQTATQAHGVAAQAIQQNQLQSQELIQQMQLSANMRSAIDEMKQQLMQVAMQPSPPSTTVQQAFDMTAPPGMPVEGGQGMEGEGQMQDPSMAGAPPQAAEQAPPEQAPPAGAPQQAAPPQAAPAPAKTAGARMYGALAGGALGAGGSYLESRSDPRMTSQKIKEMEVRHGEKGTFGNSLNLARAHIQQAVEGVTREHPVRSTIAGGLMGAGTGAALAPSIVRLGKQVKDFNKIPAL